MRQLSPAQSTPFQSARVRLVAAQPWKGFQTTHRHQGSIPEGLALQVLTLQELLGHGYEYSALPPAHENSRRMRFGPSPPM